MLYEWDVLGDWALSGSREDATVGLSKQRAVALARNLFAHIGAKDVSRIVALVEALRGEKEAYGTYFDLDDVLALIMEEWLSNNTRWSKRLNGVFFKTGRAKSYKSVLSGSAVVAAAPEWTHDAKEEWQQEDEG